MTETPIRAAFEQCVDDGGDDEGQWSTFGHVEPSRAVLMQLARAISYDTGYAPAEVKGLLRTVTWLKGYLGRLPNVYDLVACDEDGIAQGHYDDEGNEVTCTAVEPATWATVRL